MVKQSKRDKILDTAGKLFMELGFQAVSVDQIAMEVPVSKPTLYAHFKDKRDLFIAVIGQRCERALSSLKAGIAEGHTVEESLSKFAHHYLDLLLSKQALQLHRVMIGESIHFPEMAKMFYETGPRRTHALLCDFLTTQHKKGMICAPDVSLAADLFLGMIRGHAHLRCLLKITSEISAKEKEKLIKAAVKTFVSAYKAGV